MGSERRPRRFRLGPLALVLGALGLGLLLIGWNRVASSPGFCASCHAAEDAAASAARSVHAEVSCLACHTRPGLLGTLRYVPTLVREGTAQITGWDVAGGVLEPAPCERCHADPHPTWEKAEAEGAGCDSCHGDVAHPRESPPPPPTDRHPERYVQTHGREAASSPRSCATCHQQDFCTACHFRTRYPHGDEWMTEHGSATESRECALCHPSSFCAGCHGTEIPHRSTWLGEHYRALQDASASACYVCHPRTDCTSCHARHNVHREQELYG